MRVRSALRAWLALCLFASAAQADAADAVVRVTSHGASATIIHTEPGRTLLLGCAHAYEGAARNKRHVIDVPTPTQPGEQRNVGVRLLALDEKLDLSLVEIPVGPLPYCCPVATLTHHPKQCLSVGFDEMKLPAQKRSASIVSTSGNVTFTRERPWHGRSGGALIDAQTGELVGVVQGYTGPPTKIEIVGNGQGLYVSLAAIHRFLRDAGWREETPAVPGARPSRPPVGETPKHPPLAVPWQPDCPPSG